MNPKGAIFLIDPFEFLLIILVIVKGSC